MSPSDYTEELLVERPAIELFGQLGWATASAKDGEFNSVEGPREEGWEAKVVERLARELRPNSRRWAGVLAAES